VTQSKMVCMSLGPEAEMSGRIEMRIARCWDQASISRFHDHSHARREDAARL
jgi:hypothetical protein